MSGFLKQKDLALRKDFGGETMSDAYRHMPVSILSQRKVESC